MRVGWEAKLNVLSLTQGTQHHTKAPSPPPHTWAAVPVKLATLSTVVGGVAKDPFGRAAALL